ncbi:MAG: IclR family transcriptional regulator C-terminal domain-containing protein [Aeromicrobium sp.]|uniref:IclR family transcriptional regulator domain-containing protein n=1 Tax=Aeromicrobium sp. TaxID=1871063 RepID=UPI00261C38AF|nr:IclR family transcriptional regulator C-terminal domain-containing protein [Aeromicrobium sp.]MDF1704928.1 IclR family transcriptional regulator C-terminal domain-containing protein [Aeromicrobium sp.]
MQERPATSGEFVQSLARGLDVIRAFDAERPSMTRSEVAEATGLSRAAARRFLLTLVELGYVRSDGRDFALTPQVLLLGTAYLSGLGLPEIAQPHLQQLTAQTGESSSVAVLDDTEFVYVARAAARSIMNVGITVGTRFPAHATSMGRVLLAALAPADLDAHLARVVLSGTPERPATDEATVRDVLRTVAAQGWAATDQELAPGLRPVAAPIRRGSRIIAAINVSSTTAHDPSAEYSRRFCQRIERSHPTCRRSSRSWRGSPQSQPKTPRSVVMTPCSTSDGATWRARSSTAA